MADSPTIVHFPASTTIGNCTSPNGGFYDICLSSNGAGGTAVWPSANRALFSPFYLDQAMIAKAIVIQVATQSGNVDVGIYNEGFGRIVTKGTTAVAAAGIQLFDLTASVTGTASPVLNPGTYWLAMAVDNGTASFQRQSAPGVVIHRMVGCGQMVSAFVLPATLTWGAPGANYTPVITLKASAVA